MGRDGEGEESGVYSVYVQVEECGNGVYREKKQVKSSVCIEEMDVDSKVRCTLSYTTGDVG